MAGGRAGGRGGVAPTVPCAVLAGAASLLREGLPARRRRARAGGPGACLARPGPQRSMKDHHHLRGRPPSNARMGSPAHPPRPFPPTRCPPARHAPPPALAWRQAMLEAVQNHGPDVVIVDEIGTREVRYKGVPCTARAQPTLLPSLPTRFLAPSLPPWLSAPGLPPARQTRTQNPKP